MNQEAIANPRKPDNADLAAAYVRAWGEMQNVAKNAKNPAFGSNYATLDAVLDAGRDVFAKHGLALLQAPGEIEGGNVSLMGLLLHSSGQSVGFKSAAPIGQKVTAQAIGSCITYLRRYQAAAVFGMAQTDDDGNAASSGPGARTERKSNATYAATADSLITSIDAAQTLPDLEKNRDAVAELGDDKVADAYVAKKRALKGAK